MKDKLLHALGWLLIHISFEKHLSKLHQLVANCVSSEVFSRICSRKSENKNNNKNNNNTPLSGVVKSSELGILFVGEIELSSIEVCVLFPFPPFSFLFSGPPRSVPWWWWTRDGFCSRT